MNQLIAYDAARRALAEAKNFDEIREISNRAEALRAYALQAKNRQLEIDAAEIRIRAQRRIGELMVAIKEAGGLNEGGRGRGRRPGAPTIAKPDTRPTLRDFGIDHKLSSVSQLLARQPAEVFEDRLSAWRSSLVFSSKRVTTSLAGSGNDRDVGRRLLDGTRIDRIKVGSLRKMIDERLAEVALLRAIADHCQASDSLQTVGDILGSGALEQMIGGVQ